MPDWSYRTFLRPLLARLPPEMARRLAVRTLAMLGASAPGRALIDFFGHMRPDPRLAVTRGGLTCPGPVGLGALVDPGGEALDALSRFGGGFVEIGPVAAPPSGTPSWRVNIDAREISQVGAHSVTLDEVVRRLEKRASRTTPVFVRLARASSAELRAAAVQLVPLADGIILTAGDADATTEDAIQSIRAACPGARVFVSVPAGSRCFGAAKDADGVWIRGEVAGLYGRSATAAVRESIAAARSAPGADKIIIAGGVCDPADARDFLAAGATLAAVDAGLVLSGPGLVKRTNECLLSTSQALQPLPALTLDAARWSWFWALMLGIAMVGGGVLAAALACTRVVLPYDEALCGIPRAAFKEINPRLLPFMSHDRMTLAGTMLSIGVLYSAVAWHAMRRGAHWARAALVVSAISGFFSFFLFLGFGYFDPFHAFVTTVLFQFVVLTLFAPLGAAHAPRSAEWSETAAWRRAQWGQLLFVLIGIGLVMSGVVISFIGCTSVLVRTDLEFLQTTAARLVAANENLLPLIAHDRASLGGMLTANGFLIWLAAQWGFRPGERWLWRALAVGGNAAFAAGVGVHLAVGYTNWLHLAPAITGWCLWLLALALTRDWMRL